jgi:hypothetical protein
VKVKAKAILPSDFSMKYANAYYGLNLRPISPYLSGLFFGNFGYNKQEMKKIDDLIKNLQRHGKVGARSPCPYIRCQARKSCRGTKHRAPTKPPQ